MQVSVETTGSLTRKMTIAVSSDEFEDRIADRVRSTARKVSLPGFRRGRVPLREVERRFGASLRTEVASELVQSSLEEAFRQEAIPLVGNPAVELVNLESGADLEFTATFEVMPDVDLVDLSTLRVRKPVAEVGEADIDDMVESLRRQRTEWDVVERPVAADDRVIVDYSILIGGEVHGEPQIDLSFVVGDNEVRAELDAAVVDMSVGETRSFPVDIQGDSEQSLGETAAAAEAIGEASLKSVEAPSLPDLDEAFFAAFGVVDEADASATDGPATAVGEEPHDAEVEEIDNPRHGFERSLARFRANVRERMEAELQVAARSETRRQVMATLARAHGFELPRVLVEAELEQERERMAQLMGVPVEVAELGDAAHQRVRERIRTRLVIREIVQKEDMRADDARIRARIEEIAAPYEQPDEVRNWIYGDEEQLQRVELGVLEDQLVEHVLANATVVAVAATYEDVVTGTSIANLPAEEPTTSSAALGDSPIEPDVADDEPQTAGAVEVDAPGTAAPTAEAAEPKEKKGLLGRLFGRRTRS